MTNQELINEIECHNNTTAWENGGAIFIDSEKPMQRFEQIVKQAGRTIVTVHTPTKAQLIASISGEMQEGYTAPPTLGGRQAMGFVYMVIGG